MSEGPSTLPSRATVIHAVSGSGRDEWHIECRFPSGEKYAPVVVDGDHEDLADWLCAQINAREEASERAAAILGTDHLDAGSPAGDLREALRLIEDARHREAHFVACLRDPVSPPSILRDLGPRR